MRIIHLSRTKLVEKDITWKESYTDKTEFLKEQYEDIIGKGSYFRFEGKDNDSGDEYYCIIGPAKVHQPKAKWFAGVRKLPATFSAGGKYFDSMDAAAKYARETWGVRTPKTLKPYTSAALFGISKKIDEWKDKRDSQEEQEDNSVSDNKDNVSSEKEKVESFSKNKTLIKNSAEYLGLPLEYEGHKPRTKIYQENKYNVDKIIDPKTGDIKEDSPDYQALLQEVVKDPWFESLRPTPQEVDMKKRSVVSMIQKAYDEKNRKADEISEFYGVPDGFTRSMEHVFISYKPGVERNSGLTITAIGPYVSVGERHGQGNIRRDAWGKFNVYHLKKRNASRSEIFSTVDNRIKELNQKYDLEGSSNELTRSDFSYTIGGYGDDPKSRVKINSLGPESEDELERLFRVSPIEGDGALMSLNNYGQGKIIRQLAEDNNLSLEEALSQYGDDVKWETLTGAQNFTESKRDDSLSRDLKIVQKILGVLPSQVRLTGSSAFRWRDRIRNMLYADKNNRWISDREIDKAISQIIQMQAPTKTRPARDTLELYEDNRKAIESTYDETNFDTEDEAFEKANVSRELIEQTDYETELPYDKMYDDSVSQKLISERLKMLRTLRVLNELKQSGEIDIEVPNLSDEEKLKLLKMSPRVYNMNRRRYQAIENIMRDPEIQRMVDGPGKQDVHKIDRTKDALEGVGDVVTDKDTTEYTEDVLTDIGVPKPMIEDEEDIKEQIGEIGVEHHDRVAPKKKTKTPRYKSKRQKLEEALDGTLSDDEIDDIYTSKEDLLKKVYSSSLKSLIAIAKEMDNKGKFAAAEEIHKIIRKYKN